MSTSTQNTRTKEPKQSHTPPKKFVFDFMNSPSKNEDSEDFLNLSKDSHTQRIIPMIHNFNDPEDYEEAYENVCDYLIHSYNEIREVLQAVQNILNLKSLINF